VVDQILLDRVGCYPGDDEMRWWQFGDHTATALRTAQARLPAAPQMAVLLNPACAL
jgi:hypothetical protein